MTHQPQLPETPTPAKSRFRLPARLALIVGGFAVLAAIAVISNRGATPAARTVPWPPIVDAPAAPHVTGGIDEGTWLVGTDVQPGTYRSAGAKPRLLCWWGRLSDTTGEAKANIAWGVANENEPEIVTITGTDVAFKNTGCAPFVKIG